MTIDTFIRYGSLWTLVLGVFSLVFAIRSYRRQVNAQIFFEIAKRYHDMLERFPIQDWALRLHPKEKLPEPTIELQSGALRYFAMVHFAFVLHELGYLSKKLWRILQLEHRRTLTSPLLIREWCGVRREFNLFPKFVNYIDLLQSEATVVDLNVLDTERVDSGPPGPPFRRRIWRRPHRLAPTSRNCGSSD